jgi:DMSO reductase anchor subunit
MGVELALLLRGRGALARSAAIMNGPLRRLTRARFACGVAGALVLPAAALAAALPALLTAALLVAAFALALAGELGERFLFFAAAPPSKMPGSFS